MRRGATGFTVLVTGWAVLIARQALAQGGLFAGMQAGVESVFSTISTTTTFASGLVTKTESSTVYPALTLNMNTLLYPNLRMNLGGTFEYNASTMRGLLQPTTRFTTTRNRPFFLLRSTNPVLSPGFGFFRREAVDRSQGAAGFKLVNDEYAAYLGWKPEGGPRSDFQFLRTQTFDGGRAFRDTRQNFGSLISAYTQRNLNLYYRGSYLNTDDRIGRLETSQQSHAIRADYAQAFLDKRLLWNAGYNVGESVVRTTVRGTTGEVAFPVTPFSGLAALTDTPITVTLTTNGQLIDGNLTAGAGLNIGVPASPTDHQTRNIGLDLLTPTEVNRLLVWVDRDLPVDVTNAFSWEIYSSADNVIWRREAIVTLAPFGEFENRFEIDFTGITARYLKAVTAPLSKLTPNAANYPDIFITEVQAFRRRPAAEVSSRVVQNRYLLNTDVRMRLLDAPALYYEGFYLANGQGGFDVLTDTWSNGVSMTHAFGRIYSAYARFAHELGRVVRGDRTALLTNATFTVEPIPTFRTSVLYSGQNETVAGLPASRRGLYVQNAARPYHGIDVLFGAGWTATTRETGEIARDRLFNVSATILPRDRVSLTLNYDARFTERAGTFIGDPNSFEHRSYAALAVDPISSLHLIVGGEVIAASDAKTRTTLDLGASWAAFPNGALQFIFAYNEALRALEFGRDKSAVAAIRWNVSRKSFIDVSYQRTRNATDFYRIESKILSARVRFFV